MVWYKSLLNCNEHHNVWCSNVQQPCMYEMQVITSPLQSNMTFSQLSYGRCP